MNKKILKLALDAGVLNYVDLETPPRYFVHGFAEVEDVEQFAKLIVRECADLVKDFYQEDEFTCYNAAEEIKEHFGVEE